MGSGDLPGPWLALYSPGEPEYTDVVVRRVHDTLTLVCELRGDTSAAPRVYVWNYMDDNSTSGDQILKGDPKGPAVNSTLIKFDLQESDSGQYMCSAPPFSVTKYILVQTRAAQYVCDGRLDCQRGEDEAGHMCPPLGCARSDKLNCSSGRCISESACCRSASALCPQPSCCDEHPRYSRLEGYVDVEYPPLFEDRHAGDDYGFIQSTIYTVTACALIFMIAVVLLCGTECPPPEPPAEPEAGPERGSFGLARLSAIFSSRYRQVPTQSDVELTNVRSTSLNNSPTRNRTLDNYRSPTFCDLNASEFYFTNPETGDFARDLNYMARPVEFARRSSNTTLERVIDQLDRQRLTLQLGRFQLTIPRFGRRAETDRRPDTPNVAEINIDDLDFVRMTSHDTYTLNGRTIRLLGANFENYPVLPDGSRPPPYNEAMRCKFFGPPPEYLSREGLNSRVDEEARTNVEMPPCYDELGDGASSSNNNGEPNPDTVRDRAIAATSATENNDNVNNNASTSQATVVDNVDANMNVQSISSIINNLPAIDSDVNANDTSVNC
ncbi:hypothetical protein HW555_012389 [Spodoptera exigua]|uniref:Ig-like domain-containing protein n=1 Tax=Spodoptera exigua TaxID=7107 RepID=A0A835KZ37_SPOEX|nr:hypothetical protein HW555_012389 [Spodoptera exigua]